MSKPNIPKMEYRSPGSAIHSEIKGNLIVFSGNKEEKKISANVTNGNLVEKYDCSF